MNKKGQEGLTAFSILVVVAIVAIFGVLFAFSIVQYNEYAVEQKFSGGLNNEVMSSGIHYVGTATLKRVDNQVRNYEIKIDAPSKDLQTVIIDLNLNIKLKEDEAYNYIKNYKSESDYITYLNNKVQEKTKTIIIKYNAEDVPYKRMDIGKELLTEIQNIKEIEYFEINDLAIKNIDWSPEFKQILERKATLQVENGLLLKQKENLELLKANMLVVDINTYFKYNLIEKWDGKSDLIISEALIR